ncbi:MAG: hypothetical protein QM278_12685 [Pseudomonadota bacterium]|nr:hypothetical protein [Pseudomonadota bacterium]
MTVIFPVPSVGDKILALLGKKRAVFIPDIYGGFGKYAYGRAIKEPFLYALLRPKNRDLEEGWFYPDEIMPPETNEINGKDRRN